MSVRTGNQEVKLVWPTDFQILYTLDETGRNVASNIAIHMDRDRGYINTRLPQLEDYALVRKIGPSPTSGLYEITEWGQAAVQLKDRYRGADDFGALVKSYVEGELDASELEK